MLLQSQLGCPGLLLQSVYQSYCAMARDALACCSQRVYPTVSRNFVVKPSRGDALILGCSFFSKSHNDHQASTRGTIDHQSARHLRCKWELQRLAELCPRRPALTETRKRRLPVEQNQAKTTKHSAKCVEGLRCRQPMLYRLPCRQTNSQLRQGCIAGEERLQCPGCGTHTVKKCEIY